VTPGREGERRRMVDQQLRARGISDERVLAAMGSVERELFVPVESEEDAYADRALPIGYGQTISQPYVVALAFELLELSGSEHMLEVGAGSGYAACVASRLARDVIAVERIAPLAARARRALDRAGAGNVRVLESDGSRGIPSEAPFHAILVSAATPTVPMRLFHELTPDGRMVAPVGPAEAQRLDLVRHGPDGPLVTHSVPCRFVPLIGGGESGIG
jgi:protein-L-isoaspartate(D-aspartate) O-methyltransferase